MPGQGSCVSSVVRFDVAGPGPLTSWTTRPLEVFSKGAELAYPVEIPVR